MERSRASFNSASFPAKPIGREETIDELAHRALFGESLEEKLEIIPPFAGGLRERSVTAFESARLSRGILPSRPKNIQFARGSEQRPSLPGRPGLVDDENRGILLHFFANHELLAVELMALALLKFKDAPPAFRRGLAKTLRDEQQHTQWYLTRMQACGVEFGQYPVSGFFWDSVSAMESPLDYVSRLSLTFEQANLDYSLHFGEMLAEAGDHESSAILLRIYRDEIAHVGYGLKWFRRWKNDGDSDWNALKNRLPFPLSPSRAKGNRTRFNDAGRRAAGFDEDYIEQLALFERSKGRTPNVFYFNPEAEHRIGAWPRQFHPNQRQISVARDLELLCAFLARRDDVLILRRRPSDAHLLKLKRCGLTIPEIEVLGSSGSLSSANLIVERKINRLQPWSIGPDLGEVFAPLLQTLSDESNRYHWTSSSRSLFSKVDQVRSLGRWMGKSFPCSSVAEMKCALRKLSDLGFTEAILKRAFSAAGSGMMRFSTQSPEFAGGQAFSQRILAEGGVLLEPAHERIFDFSVQYQIESGKARLIGLVEQIISPSGGFLGSICQVKFCKGLDSNLAQFLMSDVLPLYADDSALNLELGEWAAMRDYEGPLGIDAYVYRSLSGTLTLRPICEVNPRYTMGRVAHELRRAISPGCGLKLEIVKAGSESGHHEAPVLDEKGRISGGTLLLTENTTESFFTAKITVAKVFSRPDSPVKIT